jgi:signal transduction histidine kinase
MDDLSLRPSGVVGGERVLIDGQPKELHGIAASYNSLADRLQKAWTQQNLLMRSMSHELLTPVTLISSNARRLARLADNLPADQSRLVESLQTEAGRVNSLVTSLIDLARGDSNNLSLQSTPINPYRLLQQIYADVQVLPWGSRLQWQDLDQADPAVNATIQGDGERLRQCVLNALENASKYSQADQPIYMLIDSTPELVRIRVEDRGPGIPEAERELVFEPFYRSKLATGEEVRGTGVGLAIVRLLIEGMGGKVKIVDQVQPGTTLQFELPICHVQS